MLICKVLFLIIWMMYVYLWWSNWPYRSTCTLQWRHNGRDSISNHQPHDCFLNRLFRHRWEKTSQLRVTGLCVGNSPEAGEFPAQMASNAENVSIWWRHHHLCIGWRATWFFYQSKVYLMCWRLKLQPAYWVATWQNNDWTKTGSLQNVEIQFCFQGRLVPTCFNFNLGMDK